MCNVPTVDNNQFDGQLYDEYGYQYNIEFNFVNNCEVTHELHDGNGEADISVHSGRYTVSLSTVDILNSCFHDTLDNSINYFSINYSINYLVFIQNRLDRLNGYYGISELAFGWFKSYLSGRTHSVKVGSTLSNPVALQHRVPQGSVLGPILFSLYTNPISSIIQSHSSIKYISTLMTLSYTFHSLQQIFLTLYKN